MLLFIISEIMVFGAFFTAYFFIRVVQGVEWPAQGTELPKLVAGVNTAILISSSFTLHWAEHAHKNGNRRGLQAGIFTTFLLGLTFLFIQVNEYVHIGFSPQDHAQGTIFYGLTGLHGAHVFVGLTLLTMATSCASSTRPLPKSSPLTGPCSAGSGCPRRSERQLAIPSRAKQQPSRYHVGAWRRVPSNRATACSAT